MDLFCKYAESYISIFRQIHLLQEISYSLGFSALISILMYLDFFVNLTKQSRGVALIKVTIPELASFIYSIEPITLEHKQKLIQFAFTDLGS